MNYIDDFLALKARRNDLRARSYYKLEEIDKKYNLVKKGQLLLDLGCFPGSWSQYCFKKTKENIKIIGVDLSETVLPHKDFFFTKKDILDLDKGFLRSCSGWSFEQVNGIISDALPNTTGVKESDSYASFELVEKVLSLGEEIVSNGGFVIIKYLLGKEVELIKKRKSTIKIKKFFKPNSTRKNSKEIFIIGEKIVKSN